MCKNRVEKNGAWDKSGGTHVSAFGMDICGERVSYGDEENWEHVRNQILLNIRGAVGGRYEDSVEIPIIEDHPNPSVGDGEAGGIYVELTKDGHFYIHFHDWGVS